MSGAKLAAGTPDEPRLYVGQPEIIGPAITADRNRMAAAVVSAIEQQATHTLFMSANVILVGRSMPHDCADHGSREAARDGGSGKPAQLAATKNPSTAGPGLATPPAYIRRAISNAIRSERF